MYLQTEKLIIRELEKSDVASVLKLVTSDDFIANIGDRGVSNEAQTLEMMAERYMYDYPDHGLFALELKTSGQFVGGVSFLKRDNLELDDVGYALIPEFYGNGYAIEATKALIEWAEHKGKAGVCAVVSPHNTASIKLLNKLQFSDLGLTELEANDHVKLLELRF